jgi:hypothetical protein
MLVPAIKGKFDYLQVDEQFHRLLANHTGNGTLDVFDLPASAPKIKSRRRRCPANKPGNCPTTSLATSPEFIFEKPRSERYLSDRAVVF